MRSVDEHLQHVLSQTREMPAETVDLMSAAGRILRQTVQARVAVPVFDNSAMDGYSVHHADVAEASPQAPVTLRVVADLPAGTSLRPEVPRGCAARIMTGAPVPPDTDTVVAVEDTDGGTDTVIITGVKAPRAHVRLAGEDVRAGDPVVAAGSTLRSLELASIAAVGVPAVDVAQRPRVAVVSTGSELVKPGEPLEHGQIPESNSVLLAHLVAEVGAEIVERTSVDDDTENFLAAVDALPPIDVLILSGGVSVGAHDVVKAAFASRGDIEFLTVPMQPGKPQGFGRLDDGPLVFCLPGNPVAAVVSFDTFVRPALQAMLGVIPPAPTRAIVGRAWHSPRDRIQNMPVVFSQDEDGRLVVVPANDGGSRSHLAGSLALVEGWAVIPNGVTEVRAGDLVDVRRR